MEITKSGTFYYNITGVNMLGSLLQLIRAFKYTQDGLPESIYEATLGMIASVLSEDAAREFSRHISATEGMYYLDYNVDVERLIAKMLESF
jgi:hypothetical protein